MKLSSFPYLVQKEILDHLSFNSLFFFSLCSKNTMNFIKETQKYQLKKIERVVYRMCPKQNDNTITVSPNVDSNLISMELYKTKADVWKDIDLVEKVRVNELKPAINFFRIPIIESDLYVKFSSDNLETILETIHDHFFDLFGDSVTYWYDFIDKDFSTEDAVPLPMIPNLHALRLIGIHVKTTELDKLLQKATCLENFSASTNFQPGNQLMEISKLYKLGTIKLETKHPLVLDVLKNFIGRRLYLISPLLTATIVIEVLKAWKSGEKYRNVEVLKFNDNIRIPDFRASIDAKEVGKEVVYEWFDKYHTTDGRNYHNAKTRLYMVRDTDGLVASLNHSRGEVFMGVWNMREKEFLEKFQ